MPRQLLHPKVRTRGTQPHLPALLQHRLHNPELLPRLLRLGINRRQLGLLLLALGAAALCGRSRSDRGWAAARGGGGGRRLSLLSRAAGGGLQQLQQLPGDVQQLLQLVGRLRSAGAGRAR